MHPNESRPGIEGIEASNELPSFQCIQMAGLSGFQWGGVHGGGILSILTQYSRLQIWFIKIIKIIKIKTWRPESDYFTLLFYSLSEFILNPVFPRMHPNESRPGIEGIEASNELPSFQCIQMAGLSGFQWGGVHGGGILSILTQYSRLQIWFIKIIKIIKIKTWRPESDYFTWRVQISLNSFWIPGSVWRI